jgi:hypothetical protein
LSLGSEVTAEFGNYTKATTAYCARYENGQETRREGDGGSFVKDTEAHLHVLFEELTLKIIMLAFQAFSYITFIVVGFTVSGFCFKPCQLGHPLEFWAEA